MNIKPKNIKKNKNKKKLLINNENDEEFVFKNTELVTEYEVINPKSKSKVEEVVAEPVKTVPKKKKDEIMEEDKFEEKIVESKPDGVFNKLNKLDNSPNPEIKTKKRLKSQGSDTEKIPENNQTSSNDNSNNKSNQNTNEIVINSTKKDSKPRKIKITQLSKKSKPNNIISFSSGINSQVKDHDQGWEYLRLNSAEEIATLIEKKDMDVELIVNLFKIMSNKSQPADYD